MTYTIAIATFLVGVLLGVSVAGRRRVAKSDNSTVLVRSHSSNRSDRGATAHDMLGDVMTRAIDSLPSGVILAEKDGTIIFKNSAARSISGVRHVDVLVDEAISGMIRTAVEHETQQRRFETSGTPSRVFDLRTKRIAGERILATVEDVTEQSRIDTVRTDFVANLSHELKTPIGGIAALADTMIGETDQAVISRLTARIVDESYRLSRIVDDLLDLSRIEFGGSDNWEPVSVSEVVGEVTARAQHEASQAGVSVQTRISDEVWVMGDRTQLVSALQNLVSNAIKYSGDGKQVKVELHVTPELANISVIDQGIGIASKDHQRIFERFYRVDRARSRSTGGSGLGLAIVRHVVSNHGGTVSVVSEEGRGSTFTIALPRVTPNIVEDSESNMNYMDATA